MAAGSTYTPIATTTLGTAASTYTFSSIPSTYTDLVLVCQLGASASTSLAIQFNGITTATYSFNQLSDDTPTGVRAGSTTANSSGWLNWRNTLASTLTMTVIANIFNYSNTSYNKATLSRAVNISGSGSKTEIIANLWRGTAAINSITLFPAAGSSTFTIGSIFTLYGIAAA